MELKQQLKIALNLYADLLRHAKSIVKTNFEKTDLYDSDIHQAVQIADSIFNKVVTREGLEEILACRPKPRITKQPILINDEEHIKEKYEKNIIENEDSVDVVAGKYSGLSGQVWHNDEKTAVVTCEYPGSIININFLKSNLKLTV